MLALKECGWPALAILCALALVGCGNPAGPTAPAAGHEDTRPFYPLTPGNRWIYAAHQTLTKDSLGTHSNRTYDWLFEIELQPESSPDALAQGWVREAIGTVENGVPPSAWYFNYLRQDSEGLYESVPAGYLRTTARRAAVPMDGPGSDATRLIFPLRRGLEWETPAFATARPEAIEFETVPAGRFAAWRIALSLDSPVGKGTSYCWYGNIGLVRLESHGEFLEAILDSTGATVGHETYTWDGTQQLQSYVLRGPQGRLVPVVPENR